MAAASSSDTSPARRASISLVIPVHNEEANIGGVVTNAREALTALSDDWEIVLVDDGSSDATTTVARDTLAGDADRLATLRHRAKSGYAVTVLDGLRVARGELLSFVDGDAQFDPRDLRLLAARLDRADLVTGWRVKRADPFHRHVVSTVLNILVRTMYGVRVHDVDCGLKIMRREVFAASSPILARSALFNTEIFFKATRCGYRVVEVQVPHHPRVAGRRSGGRLIPILRAVRDVIRLRIQLRGWQPRRAAQTG